VRGPDFTAPAPLFPTPSSNLISTLTVLSNHNVSIAVFDRLAVDLQSISLVVSKGFPGQSNLLLLALEGNWRPHKHISSATFRGVQEDLDRTSTQCAGAEINIQA
jgi:hypothetical protein